MFTNSEQERQLMAQERDYRGMGLPETYLGKHCSALRDVPNYKIARQARADAFADIEQKGLAYAYATAHPAVKHHWSEKFDSTQVWDYVSNYRQAVLGYFMAMGE